MQAPFGQKNRHGPRQIIKQEALNAIYSKKALLALMVR